MAFPSVQDPTTTLKASSLFPYLITTLLFLSHLLLPMQTGALKMLPSLLPRTPDLCQSMKQDPSSVTSSSFPVVHSSGNATKKNALVVVPVKLKSKLPMNAPKTFNGCDTYSKISICFLPLQLPSTTTTRPPSSGAKQQAQKVCIITTSVKMLYMKQ